MRFPSHLLQAGDVPIRTAHGRDGCDRGRHVRRHLGDRPGDHARQSPKCPPQTAQERPTSKTWWRAPIRCPIAPPTPAFDTSGPPNYAAAAKEKAQAELGGQSPTTIAMPEERQRRYRSRRATSGHSTGTGFY